jgi:predicted phosphate transport protein (TIGR00153 family)
MAAKNSVQMAGLLTSAVNSEITQDRDVIFNQINKMGNTGDDITHKIYLCLDKIYFTPLNRNDIHTLAATIDDVADTIKEASGRMYLYNIDEYTLPVKEIAAIILKASTEIAQAVCLLRTTKKNGDLADACFRVKSYERQSDELYYHAVAELFSNEKDLIRLIKYRDVLSSLESAVVKCKNVADVLNTISINK